MDLEGWHPDPFGIHEERLFRSGEATSLVKDDGIGFVDPPPADTGIGNQGFRSATPGRAWSAPASRVRNRVLVSARRLLGVALVLIVVGGLVEILSGGGGRQADTTQTPATLGATTSTINPLVRWRIAISNNTTLTSVEVALNALPKTTETSIEMALAGLRSSSPTTRPAATSTTAGTTTTTTKPSPPKKPTTTAPRPVTTTRPVATTRPVTTTTSEPGTTTTSEPGTTTTSEPGTTTTSEPGTTTTSEPGTTTTSEPGTTTTSS